MFEGSKDRFFDVDCRKIPEKYPKNGKVVKTQFCDKMSNFSNLSNFLENIFDQSFNPNVFLMLNTNKCKSKPWLPPAFYVIKNIVPSRSYSHLKVGATVQLQYARVL